MKKSIRKLVAVVLACLMAAALLAACGNNGGSSPAPSASSQAPSAGSPDPGASSPAQTGGGGASASDRVLNVGVFQDPGSLHPLAATGAGGFLNVARAYMDAPFDNLPDGSLEMVLVESIETVSDINYKLHLRRGVTFSNGSDFRANDFMFSMELSRAHPQHMLNVKAIDFEKSKIEDEYTVDLWLTQYDIGNWPGMCLLYIFDEETYDEADFALNPVGTGPYVVTDYVVNSHVTMEAREGFWGGEVAIKKIRFQILNEESQRVNALVTGDVDKTRIPLKDIDYVESLGGYDVTNVSAAMATCAYFNISPDGVLGTLEARLAVMYAIDRQSIADLAFYGMTKPTTWVVSDEAVDYEPRFSYFDVYTNGQNLEKAKQYAEQSGLVGKTVRITSNGELMHNTTAEIIQNNLNAIGVNSTITIFDQATYFGNVLMNNENFDMGLLFVSCPPKFAIDMLTMYPTFIDLGWEGKDYDDYVAMGRRGMSMTDDKARGDVIADMLKIFEKYHPWFTFVEMYNPRAVSKDLGGVEFYGDGSIKFKYWYWK